MRSTNSHRPRGGNANATRRIALLRKREIPRRAQRYTGYAKSLPPASQPWEETGIQQEIHREAMIIIEKARASLSDLAHRSHEMRSSVSCDQEDWPGIIRDCFEDMAGDTFGCLPAAIERAKRELRTPPEV